MKNKLIYIVLPVFLHYFLFANFAEKSVDSEDIVLDKNKITIYDLGSTDKINHFRAHYTVDSSMQYFANLILNPENHVRWVHNIKSAEKLNASNDSILYTQILIGVKSVFKKEAIVKTTVKSDDKSQIIRIVQQIDDSMEYEAKHDKLNIFTANWTIKYISDNKTDVELTFLGEKDDYPDFIDSYLRSLFIKKLYKLAYRSRKQVFKNMNRHKRS